MNVVITEGMSETERRFAIVFRHGKCDRRNGLHSKWCIDRKVKEETLSFGSATVSMPYSNVTYLGATK